MKEQEVIEFVKWVVRKKIWISKSNIGNDGLMPHKSYKNLLKEWKEKQSYS